MTRNLPEKRELSHGGQQIFVTKRVGSIPMTKDHISAKYTHPSSEERSSFDRWLQSNAVIGSILAAALVVAALIGWRTPGPVTAPALTPTQTTSFQEQHGLAHLEYLPVDQIENQALVFSVTNRGADTSIDSSVATTQQR
jgi:hypothetical protein